MNEPLEIWGIGSDGGPQIFSGHSEETYEKFQRSSEEARRGSLYNPGTHCTRTMFLM